MGGRLIEQGQGRSEQHFSRTQHHQLFPHPPFGISSAKLSRAKFAGREIERRETYFVALLGNACQEVVLLRLELRVGRRARRDHARHFALDDLLRHPRVFHLIADGDLESLANQLGDVVLRRVIRHAAHRNGDALFLVARSQRDLQLLGRDHRVFKEQLVEITQAKEQQRMGMLFLDGCILPHQRRGRLGHRTKRSGVRMRGL